MAFPTFNRVTPLEQKRVLIEKSMELLSAQNAFSEDELKQISYALEMRAVTMDEASSLFELAQALLLLKANDRKGIMFVESNISIIMSNPIFSLELAKALVILQLGGILNEATKAAIVKCASNASTVARVFVALSNCKRLRLNDDIVAAIVDNVKYIGELSTIFDFDNRFAKEKIDQKIFSIIMRGVNNLEGLKRTLYLLDLKEDLHHKGYMDVVIDLIALSPENAEELSMAFHLLNNEGFLIKKRLWNPKIQSIVSKFPKNAASVAFALIELDEKHILDDERILYILENAEDAIITARLLVLIDINKFSLTPTLLKQVALYAKQITLLLDWLKGTGNIDVINQTNFELIIRNASGITESFIDFINGHLNKDNFCQLFFRFISLIRLSEESRSRFEDKNLENLAICLFEAGILDQTKVDLINRNARYAESFYKFIKECNIPLTEENFTALFSFVMTNTSFNDHSTPAKSLQMHCFETIWKNRNSGVFKYSSECKSTVVDDGISAATKVSVSDSVTNSILLSFFDLVKGKILPEEITVKSEGGELLRLVFGI